MAKISNILQNECIPDTDKEKMATCFFCNEKISSGGFWASDDYIGVCSKCNHNLIDLLIDTLEDTEQLKGLSIDEKLNVILEIAKQRLIKKENLYNERSEKMKIDYMKKFGLKYYGEMGIIDYFGLTMSVDELKDKVRTQEIFDTSNKKLTENDVNECVSRIKDIIKNDTGEEPHTIKFFAIPNFDYNDFNLGCVAKIDNNGSTYIFAREKSFFEYINTYSNDIEKIY